MFDRKPLLKIKMKAFLDATKEVSEQIYAFSYEINQRLINEGYNIESETFCNIESFILDISSNSLLMKFKTKDDKIITLHSLEELDDNTPEKIFIGAFKSSSDLLYNDLLKYGYQNYFDDNIYKGDKINFYHDKATLDSVSLLKDGIDLNINIDKYTYNTVLNKGM